MLLCLLVIVEALKIEHVLVQLILCILPGLFLTTDCLITLSLEFLILIAVIVASRLLAVLRPLAHTQPAKLISAQLASHVITALVFFYWFATRRALLGVGHDPSDILALVRVFEGPIFSLLAVTWPMRLIATLEAKAVAALATHLRHSIVLVLYAVIAVLERTPPHILVIVSERFAKPLLIQLQIISWKVLVKERVWHDNIAKNLGALDVDWLKPFVDFLANVGSPIIYTKLMPTTQAVWFWILACWLELDIADLAVALMLSFEGNLVRWLFFVKFGIKGKAYFLPDWFFIAKPFILEAIDVPFEVAKHHKSLVNWTAK